MSKKTNPNLHRDEPMIYQIRIKGHLNSHWANVFENLTITLENNGDTLLTGPVADQAALHGVLKKVRDFGMPLDSVIRVQSTETHPNRSKEEKNNEHR